MLPTFGVFVVYQTSLPELIFLCLCFIVQLRTASDVQISFFSGPRSDRPRWSNLFNCFMQKIKTVGLILFKIGFYIS